MNSWSLGLLLACLAFAGAARPSEFLTDASSTPRAADLAHVRSLLMKGAANVAADRLYPYYVQIYDFDPADKFVWFADTIFTKFNTNDLKTKCGGVMIPPPVNGTYSYVLTAASCVAAKANPVVVVGATKTDYLFNNARKPQWTGITALPIIRTVYASYPHDSWNKVPGSEYDIALLVLDAQAPPYTGSDCGAQCIAMSTGRAADGTTLTSVGQGSARSASFEPSDLLQELAFKTISTDACNTARGLPAISPNATFQGLKRWWQQHFTAGAVTGNQLCATSTTQAAGLCRLDAGNPLVFKGSAPSALSDQLYGVGSQIMESCNSQADPSVFTDISKVVTWVQNKQKSLSPVVDKSGNLVASSSSAKPLYNYAMKIKFVDKVTGNDVSCGNAEVGLSPALGVGPMAQVWSQWMLSKGFFDPVSGTSYKLHREYNKPNPFAVQLVSCTAGVVKLEWTSSKNYAAMKAAMDAALLPANVAGWSDGARYWAISMMCETNMGNNFQGFPAYFEISTGKGAWKKFLASANNGRYLVDRTGTIPNYADVGECQSYRNDAVPAGGARRRSAF